MTTYNDTKLKISNAVRAIEALKEAQFPQDSGHVALKTLRKVFETLSEKLDRSMRLSDPIARNRSIETFSADANLKLLQVLPTLGFILRSINVRNAFEFLDPLQSIANCVLQGRCHLILSSEWDYVPFAWPQNLEDLRSFVLIGLPATEADSALLIPLAGHELGHAVWRNRRLEGSVLNTIQYHVHNLYEDPHFKDDFARAYPHYDAEDLISRHQRTDSLALCVDLALHQAQELFCDMFAYGLFGASYGHAFAYLISPGSNLFSSPKYPSHRERMETLGKIATGEGASFPTLSDLGITAQSDDEDKRRNFEVRVAEKAVKLILDALWNQVSPIVSLPGVRRPSPTATNRCLADFRMGCPSDNPPCLGDIINAGWAYYLEAQAATRASSELREKMDSLNEMTLKTVEIMEYRRKLSNDTHR